jgi:hypothetical protein
MWISWDLTREKKSRSLRRAPFFRRAFSALIGMLLFANAIPGGAASEGGTWGEGREWEEAWRSLPRPDFSQSPTTPHPNSTASTLPVTRPRHASARPREHELQTSKPRPGANRGTPAESQGDVGEYEHGIDQLGAMTLADQPRRTKHRRRKHHGGLRNIKLTCEPTSPVLLKQLMGGAFNARYMSIERPDVPSEPVENQAQLTKGQQRDDPNARRPLNVNHLPFHVGQGYARVLEDEPIYRLVSNRRLRFKRKGKRRPKRAASQERPPETPHGPDAATMGVIWFLDSISTRRRRDAPMDPEEIPWKCESRVVWEDLGTSYFPRYLRTIECLGARCWFGHFRCSPKAFTIKVLKRQSDICIPIRLPDSATDDVAVKYEEEWVFEERSITFCCECTK